MTSIPVVLLRYGFLLWTGQEQKGIPLDYSEIQRAIVPCNFDRDPLFETELRQGHENKQLPVSELNLHYNLVLV